MCKGFSISGLFVFLFFLLSYFDMEQLGEEKYNNNVQLDIAMS